jgi:hypothetical protein
MALKQTFASNLSNEIAAKDEANMEIYRYLRQTMAKRADFLDSLMEFVAQIQNYFPRFRHLHHSELATLSEKILECQDVLQMTMNCKPEEWSNCTDPCRTREETSNPSPRGEQARETSSQQGEVSKRVKAPNDEAPAARKVLREN